MQMATCSNKKHFAGVGDSGQKRAPVKLETKGSTQSSHWVRDTWARIRCEERQHRWQRHEVELSYERTGRRLSMNGTVSKRCMVVIGFRNTTDGEYIGKDTQSTDWVNHKKSEVHSPMKLEHRKQNYRVPVGWRAQTWPTLNLVKEAKPSQPSYSGRPERHRRERMNSELASFRSMSVFFPFHAFHQNLSKLLCALQLSRIKPAMW